MARPTPHEWCKPIEDLDPNIFGEVLRRILNENPTTGVVELRHRVICEGSWRWLEVAILDVTPDSDENNPERLWPKLDTEVSRAGRAWANTIPLVVRVRAEDAEVVALYRSAPRKPIDLPRPPTWDIARPEVPKAQTPRALEQVKTEAPPAAPPAQPSLF
mgnify:CR=1 FL=1